MVCNLILDLLGLMLTIGTVIYLGRPVGGYLGLRYAGNGRTIAQPGNLRTELRKLQQQRHPVGAQMGFRWREWKVEIQAWLEDGYSPARKSRSAAPVETRPGVDGW